MTSSEIRQSYLDFFKSKQHAIVPSSSLMPDSPNLLFTNAGMNQFVPIFLGETKCPYKPGRAADTQKCIRAGGKHNDLEDVGLDTYHHTFFEMLGNWSFGDYFKKEAIEWAWELVVDVWKFPPSRVYATVYKPGKGDPAEFDQEAYDYWAKVFEKAGLDPKVHICFGGKKDNFWMMGDTGPCGPCSELHIDLTPEGDTKGMLVNAGDARCMEIWNLVFIQFNANADGTFVPLPAQHVDTGMGFERVCGIMQNTKFFTDFKNAKISNYETDVFYPIFKEIEKISGKTYKSTLPAAGATPNAQEKIDIAFRVIADHIRTLGFSIADGIIPSNEGRGYVLRRILRRAVRYGRQLDLHDLFFYKLVDILAQNMGDIFPELREKKDFVKKIIRAEEESFSKTLDRGIELFESIKPCNKTVSGEKAFELYDTYGFPIDLTQLIAREKGWKVDMEAFDLLMREQRLRSKVAQKKSIIEVQDMMFSSLETKFVGDEEKENVDIKKFSVPWGGTESFTQTRFSFSPTPFYAEMGGQVSDQGIVHVLNRDFKIVDARRTSDGNIYHIVEDQNISDLQELLAQWKELDSSIRSPLYSSVDMTRRKKIESHHSATHIMHWALREVLGNTVRQKGSYVGPDRLRFDFAHMEAMKPEEIREVEKLVNEKITASVKVNCHKNVPYSEVKNDPSILQFFGDKYGEIVRVVDIGGYSKELCGGTHVSNTKDIGFFHIISESAIAAGIRRIEAASGKALKAYLLDEFQKQNEKFRSLNEKKTLNAMWDSSTSVRDEDYKNEESFLTRIEVRQNLLLKFEEDRRSWEKEQSKNREQELSKLASAKAPELLAQKKSLAGIPCVIADLGEADGALLTKLVDVMKTPLQGVIVLASHQQGKVSIVAAVSPAHASKIQAGKIIQQIAPLVGGKGGGRPELAQGGGTNPAGIPVSLKKAEDLLRV